MESSNMRHGGDGSKDTTTVAGPGPVAADRPLVNGTGTSSEELRARIGQLQDADRQRVEELRAEVAETAEELSARLDVPARVQAGMSNATASLRVMLDGVRPYAAWLTGAGALVILVIGLRRRRRGKRG